MKSSLSCSALCSLAPLAALAALAQPSAADSELDYGKLGRLIYSAWHCAAISAIADEEPIETERLFRLGYENAQVLLGAIKSGEVPDDAFDNMPIGLTLNLVGGPTDEFQLGVLWARIEGSAYSNHRILIDSASSDEVVDLGSLSAANACFQPNCVLLK